MTIRALHDLSPKLIVSLGIAWGGERARKRGNRFTVGQRLGDVLVASRVSLIDQVKIAKDGIPQNRGTIVGLNGDLAINIATTATALKVRVQHGLLISTPTLLDNKLLRDNYLQSNPGAIGGEMEFLGIHHALRDSREIMGREATTSIVLVKAICDWGYGKNLNKAQKDKNQKLAASKVRLVANFEYER